MTEAGDSPLERMLAAWVDDRDRGELAPVGEYLRLFEEASADSGPQAEAAAHVVRVLVGTAIRSRGTGSGGCVASV